MGVVYRRTVRIKNFSRQNPAPLLVNEDPKPRPPERCYGSDVWYPKCDVLVPTSFPQFPYHSTTSYLPSP